METFSWVDRKNDRLLFPRERKLLNSKRSYQWTTFKRSHRKGSSLKGKKRRKWRLYTFEFTLELQRRINTWERAKGWLGPQRSSWGLLLAWFREGSSSLCQPRVWAPRTFQPKRQERPAVRDCSRMHLVPNMKRHLKKHLDHEIKEAVQQGGGSTEEQG